MRLPTALLALLTGACTGGGDEGPALPLAPVEIIVDTMGVPHVYAESDRDAFFASGYQMASDRLFQMQMVRLRAYGRWSEIHGESALPDDELARLFDWAGHGRADAGRMRAEDPATWEIATAWVAGVNQRIDEVLAGEVALPWGFGPDELDFLPERWTEEDPLVIAKMTSFGNDLTLDREILATLAARYFPDALAASELLRPAATAFTVPPDERPATYARGSRPPADRPTRRVTAPPAPVASPRWEALGRLRTMGSNNFAIEGRFTADGRPIVAGDPHLGFDFPGAMYALHVNSKAAGKGGTLDVAGFAVTGTPGVSLGHSDRVAWTATTAFADVMDMWDVPSAGGVITLGDEQHAIAEREEIFRVREQGQPAGEGREESMTVREVPDLGGVLLPDDIAPIPVASPGREVLLRWTGFEPGWNAGLLDLVRAGSRDDFEGAIDRMQGMGFNFVAADAEGVAYRVGLRVPDRGPPTPERAPWQVLDGTDAGSLWTGAVLPPEKLPRSRGGARGWIATANNDPFGFTANGRVDDDPWYYGAFYEPGWRGGRLEEEITRLSERGAITREDAQALQTDLHDNLAPDLLPLLAAAWARVDADEALAAYRDRPDLDRVVAILVEEWDGEMRRDSAGALAFHAYCHLLAAEMLQDDFSVLFAAVLDMQPVYMLKVALLAARRASAGPDPLVEDGLDAALLAALDRTASFLTERFGGVEPDGYAFGDLHVSSFDGAYGRGLDLGTFPTDGGETTVNVSPSLFLQNGDVGSEWRSHWGPLERTVTTFAVDGTPESWIAYPVGQVADPESPHFADGREDWLAGRYRKLLFGREEVLAAQESRTTLGAR